MPYTYDESGVNRVLDMFKTRNAEGGWTTQIGGDIKKGDVTLEWKMYPELCRLAAYRTQGIIYTSKEEVIKYLWGIDEARAKKNDPKVIRWKVIQQGDGWKIIEQTVSMGGVLFSDRYVVFCQVRIDVGNKTYLVAYSVTHPLCPTPQGHVLTSLHMSVYEYVDNGDNTTTLTRITQVDPNGTIPEFVINAFTGGLVNLFKQWKQQ